MIKNKILLLILLLVVGYIKGYAQVVEINPEKPQVGDIVTVKYHSAAPNAVMGSRVDSLTMVFTYSTFYSLPWKMPMKKEGRDWVVSFKVAPYATFATFYFQSGELIDKPAVNQHYHIAIYKGNERVEHGYLHESYSLGAQMAKSPDLPAKRMALLQQELKVYPRNFEAKIRVLQAEMATAKSRKQSQKFREEARQLIAQRLAKNPTNMRNINYATMGYLIIEENTRVDSVYNWVKTTYPNTAVGRELFLGDISKEKPSVKMVAKLDSLLRIPNLDEENAQSIHGMLFDYYAKTENEKKAVAQVAASLKAKDTPYTSRELKEIAQTLTKHRLAPSIAINYANQSLAKVDKWPIGIIRYFQEYGYIRPYVAPELKAQKVSEARSQIYALIALNNSYLGKKEAAILYVKKAEQELVSRESLLDVAKVYERNSSYKDAFNTLWKVLLKDPSDTAVVALAQTDFLKFNGSQRAFEQKIAELEALRLAQLKGSLRKQLMNKPSPELNAITDLQGKPVTKEMMAGKIVVMDFWATWCIPCMQELPYLQKVYDKYKDNPRVKFMVVNSGARNSIEDAQKWAAKNGQYSFPLFYNGDPDIGEKVGFAFIPTVAVLDESGKMQFRTVGFEGAELEHKIAAEIDILLEGI